MTGKYFKCKGEITPKNGISLPELGLERHSKLCEGCPDHIQSQKKFENFLEIYGLSENPIGNLPMKDGRYYAKCPFGKKNAKGIVYLEETEERPPKRKGIGINV